MKRNMITVMCLFSFLLALVSCKGAKEIQGNWYGVNSDQIKIDIELTEETITFHSDG